MSDYYKSLISKEEAIAALLKDCKKREENNTVAKPRLKPNLNFFQRTVSNLVSVNKRIDERTKDFRETVNGASSSTSYVKNKKSIHRVKTSPKSIVPIVLSSSSDSDGDEMKKIRNSKSQSKKRKKIEPKSIDSIVISSGESSSSSSCDSDCSCSSSSSSNSSSSDTNKERKPSRFKRSRISDTDVIIVNSSTDSD